MRRPRVYQTLLCALCAVGLALLIAGGQAICQELPVLDLTAPRPAGTESLGVPGIVVGGVVGVPNAATFPQRYSLPLEARIRRIKPSPLSRQQEFFVELELWNRGDSPFYLPQLRDEMRAHRPGNKARRRFSFYLDFSWPEIKEQERTLVGLTEGSDSVPESLLRLGPGESVLVLLPGNFDPVREHLPSEPTEVGLRIVCTEYLLEDDRYFIKSVSEEVGSQNTVNIPLSSNSQE